MIIMANLVKITIINPASVQYDMIKCVTYVPVPMTTKFYVSNAIFFLLMKNLSLSLSHTHTHSLTLSNRKVMARRSTKFFPRNNMTSCSSGEADW